jgi:hypothetical protein
MHSRISHQPPDHFHSGESAVDPHQQMPIGGEVRPTRREAQHGVGSSPHMPHFPDFASAWDQLAIGTVKPSHMVPESMPPHLQPMHIPRMQHEPLLRQRPPGDAVASRPADPRTGTLSAQSFARPSLSPTRPNWDTWQKPYRLSRSMHSPSP